MNSQKRKQILKDKLLLETCSQKELKELYCLLKRDGAEQELDKLIAQQWAKEGVEGMLLTDADSSLLFKRILEKTQLPKTVFWTYQRIAGVAASILVAAALVWLFLLPSTPERPPEIQWITKTTANGQRAKVTLKDGSVVTLNAGSSISYPTKFALHSREVKLSGEAFFEVQRDPSRPFTVESKGLLTTVLGTSFNIRSFQNKQTEVTVATGKVRVAPIDQSTPQEAFLIPNQQAVYSGVGKPIVIKEVDIAHFLAWKNKDLYFDMIPFREVIATLERWYGVEIELLNHVVDECTVKARYQNESLATVLNGLQLLVNFEYRIADEKHISVKGRSCGK